MGWSRPCLFAWMRFEPGQRAAPGSRETKGSAGWRHRPLLSPTALSLRLHPLPPSSLCSCPTPSPVAKHASPARPRTSASERRPHPPLPSAASATIRRAANVPQRARQRRVGPATADARPAQPGGTGTCAGPPWSASVAASCAAATRGAYGTELAAWRGGLATE